MKDESMKNSNMWEGQQKYRQLRNQINRDARKSKKEWLVQGHVEIKNKSS